MIHNPSKLPQSFKSLRQVTMKFTIGVKLPKWRHYQTADFLNEQWPNLAVVPNKKNKQRMQPKKFHQAKHWYILSWLLHKILGWKTATRTKRYEVFTLVLNQIRLVWQSHTSNDPIASHFTLTGTQWNTTRTVSGLRLQLRWASPEWNVQLHWCALTKIMPWKRVHRSLCQGVTLAGLELTKTFSHGLPPKWRFKEKHTVTVTTNTADLRRPRRRKG